MQVERIAGNTKCNNYFDIEWFKLSRQMFDTVFCCFLCVCVQSLMLCLKDLLIGQLIVFQSV